MQNVRSVVVPAVASAATLTVLVGFFAAGFFMRGWWDQQRGVVAPPVPGPGERFVADVSADDDPFWGPENARVTVVEFADFQCPFCQRHVEETLAQLKDAYRNSVRYVFRDFPIDNLHPQAFMAAEASQCAFAQGEFWAFHDLLFENQDALAEADLKQHAAALSLDTVAFEDCLESGAYRDEVQADFDDGVAYGVTGTPAFFVNGRAVDGAASFSVFQRIIDEELAKSASR